VSAALVVCAPGAAAAPMPSSSAPLDGCGGIVSGQLAAASPGVVGEHAAAPGPGRRDGLGNLSRELGFASMGEFGSFLATLDGVEATSCGA
jgi:hypothetical protein